eukprot:g1431.t1
MIPVTLLLMLSSLTPVCGVGIRMKKSAGLIRISDDESKFPHKKASYGFYYQNIEEKEKGPDPHLQIAKFRNRLRHQHAEWYTREAMNSIKVFKRRVFVAELKEDTLVSGAASSRVPTLMESVVGKEEHGTSSRVQFNRGDIVAAADCKEVTTQTHDTCANLAGMNVLPHFERDKLSQELTYLCFDFARSEKGLSCAQLLNVGGEAGLISYAKGAREAGFTYFQTSSMNKIAPIPDFDAAQNPAKTDRKMSMNVRDIREKDVPEVRELIRRDLVPPASSASSSPSVRKFMQRAGNELEEALSSFSSFVDDYASFKVIVANDRVFGCVGFKRTKRKDVVELKHLVVSTSRRREGAGRRLIREGIAHLAKGTTIYLDTLPCMRAAASLYLSEGFRVFKRRTVGDDELCLVTYRRAAVDEASTALEGAADAMKLKTKIHDGDDDDEWWRTTKNVLVRVRDTASGEATTFVVETDRKKTKGDALAYVRLAKRTDPYARLYANPQNRKIRFERGKGVRNSLFEVVRASSSSQQQQQHAKRYAFRLGTAAYLGRTPRATTRKVETFFDALRPTMQGFVIETVLSDAFVFTTAPTISAASSATTTLPAPSSSSSSRVSAHELRSQGCTVVRNAVPSDVLLRALAHVNRAIGTPGALVRGGVQPGTVKLDGKYANAPEVMALYPERLVRSVVGDPIPPRGCQLALRFPESEDDSVRAQPLSGRRWHTDALRQGKFHPFSLLVGVALSDCARSRCGNLCVFPGKHLEIGRRTTTDRGRLAGVDDEDERAYGATVSSLAPWGDDRILPDLGPPKELMLRKGDVVLAHVDTPHRGGPNTASADIRYMAYFRIKHASLHRTIDAAALRRDPFADWTGYAMRVPQRRRRILTDAQIERFRRDGILVVPNMLSAKEAADARRKLERTMKDLCGFDSSDPKRSSEKIRALSSTDGSGGVLDIFYPQWKLKLTLLNRTYANAYADLYDATYGTNEGIYTHAFADTKVDVDEQRSPVLAHIDRVGYRLTERDSRSAGEGTDAASRARKRRLQRSLTPHLDCAPFNMNACLGKAHKRWRPIQCMLSLTDTTKSDCGGFEAIPGFHRQFEAYFRHRTDVVSKGDFTAIRYDDLLKRVRHVAVPAGAAVFWDQRIVHANSLRNAGNEPRAVVYGGFLPRVPRNIAYAQEQLRRARAYLPQCDFWLNPERGYVEGYAAMRAAKGSSAARDPIRELLSSAETTGDSGFVESILGIR